MQRALRLHPRRQRLQPFRRDGALEAGHDRLPVGLHPRREPQRRTTAERVHVHRARLERPTAEGGQEVREMPAELLLAGIERADRGIAGKGRDQ
jgi:hypothetical protein